MPTGWLNTIARVENSTIDGSAAAELPAPAPTRSRGQMILKEIVDTLVLFVIVFVISQALMGNFVIEQQSAVPNYLPGERILVDKVIYRATGLHRGDLIVTHSPRDPKIDIFKRVIGLPGEKVEISNNTVMVNGVKIDEPYLAPGAQTSRGGAQSWALKDNEYFVMGDNRSNSEDSRAWGALPQENIVGRAWIRYWPLNKISLILGVNY